MTRVEWVSMLARSRAETVRDLAGIVMARLPVDVTRPPSTGLVLVAMVQSVDRATFSPGEVLVTTCEVRVRDVLGTSVILGGDGEKARHCAIVDAALQLAIPECAAIECALEAERRWLTACEEEDAMRRTTERVGADTRPGR